MHAVWRFILTSLFLLVSCRAGAQTALVWKLVPGETFEMQRTATQDQRVETRGKEFKQHAVSTWRVHVEVLAAAGDAHMLQATLKTVDHKLTGSVGAGVEHSFADKLQGRQFKLRVSPRGRVLALEGYPDFVDAAADKQPERARALRVLLPEEALREAFADLLGPLPDEAVERGSTWQRTVRETIPHFGALRATWDFHADGPAADGYRLGYTIKTTYQLPAAAEAPLARVVSGSLQSENGRGSILFDVQRGRLVRHERRQTIRGNLTVETMGMQVPLEFASDNVLEVRLK